MENTEQQRDHLRRLVEASLRSALSPDARLPREEEDWVEGGFLDSMAHVDVLLSIETAVKLPELFSRSGSAPPTSTRKAVDAIQQSLKKLGAAGWPAGSPRAASSGVSGRAGIVGWARALGSDVVLSERIDREYGLPSGTLSARAGVESVRRASKEEDHVSLVETAARQSLEMAGLPVEQIGWIIATSETYPGYPSLAASVHSALLAPSTCNALDVGGACVGLVNALVVAEAFLKRGSVYNILVVSADVHSRVLAPPNVPGEFGGLFGDGACAFVLGRLDASGGAGPYLIGPSVGGCAGSFASALRVRSGKERPIDLEFHGEALAHAAVDQMGRIIRDLESHSGASLETVSAFALHQPNPRLVDMMLRHAKLPADKVPPVARTCGNLGPSTCGVALSVALDAAAQKQQSERGPIFLAAVGPGMLWAGMALG